MRNLLFFSHTSAHSEIQGIHVGPANSRCGENMIFLRQVFRTITMAKPRTCIGIARAWCFLGDNDKKYHKRACIFFKQLPTRHIHFFIPTWYIYSVVGPRGGGRSCCCSWNSLRCLSFARKSTGRSLAARGFGSRSWIGSPRVKFFFWNWYCQKRGTAILWWTKTGWPRKLPGQSVQSWSWACCSCLMTPHTLKKKYSIDHETSDTLCKWPESTENSFCILTVLSRVDAAYLRRTCAIGIWDAEGVGEAPGEGSGGNGPRISYGPGVFHPLGDRSCHSAWSSYDKVWEVQTQLER